MNDIEKQIIPAIAGLLLLFVLGWYIDSIAHDEITQAVRVIVYTLAFAIVAILAGIFIFSVLLVRERFLKERANRRMLEREANVMYLVADEGQQVYIRDTDHKAVWRNAHLDTRIYANGELVIPSPTELVTWQTYILRNRPNIVQEIVSPALPAQTQVDLLTALDNVQRCLIVGASNAGKTTLLQWLVQRRQQTSNVIVIDPHAYPNKWPGCAVVGTGRNYQEIDRALGALVKLMIKRYDEIGKGLVAEQAHPKITILIDEWRAIVYNVKGAGQAIKVLLTESRKAAFSVFVASHSDRAKPLGLEGEYDLKDGFAVVRLALVNGQRQATLDTGNGEIPATLPGPYSTLALPAHITTKDEVINLKAEPEPTPTEARILDLHAAGASFNEIARQVYGHTGGKQTQKVRDILQKFSRN